MIQRFSAPAVFVVFAIAMLIVVPLVLAGNGYWLTVLTTAALLAFGSLGVWLTFSIGRINIAQGAFALIGGYVVAILSTRYHVSFWLALPLAVFAAVVVATLVGWPILRLRGVYFAMITLSLTEVASLAFLNGGNFTAGASGITSIPRPTLLSSTLAIYIASALLLLAGIVLVWRFAVSPVGAVFRSLRQSEELAASLGINIARYRLLAFVVSSGMGAAAGAMFAVFQQNIFPTSYTVNDSVNFMLYCFLGGLQSVGGPVLGSFLLVIAFQLLSVIQRFQALLYGIFMIAAMLFLPNGLVSLPQVIASRRRSRAGMSPAQ
jgi:branched-chain amino acid transport system permease protein